MLTRQERIQKEAEGLAVSIIDCALAKRGKTIVDISNKEQRKVVTMILDQFPNVTRLAEKIVDAREQLSALAEI